MNTCESLCDMLKLKHPEKRVVVVGNFPLVDTCSALIQIKVTD